MRKRRHPGAYLPVLLLLATAICLTRPIEGRAQVALEARGDLGYNRVKPVDWLGVGVFDANRFVAGGDMALVVGRRGPQALQVFVEGGYQRLLAYRRIVGGQPTDRQENVARLLGGTRIWINDGAFYGEFGVGIAFLTTQKDPVVSAAIGKLFDVGDRLSIPVRVRAAVLFDTRAFVVPFYVQTGISYRLSG